jgi:hypothetical protein
MPALAFDLSHYVASPGSGLLSLYAVSPWLWTLTAAASAAWLGYSLLTRSNLTWTSAAVLMFLGPPRIATSYLAFFVPAAELTRAEVTSPTKPPPDFADGRASSRTPNR